MNTQPRNLLDADELLNEPLKPARRRKRLANMLIDICFFYVIVFTVSGVIVFVEPAFLTSLESINPLVDRLVSALLILTYYVTFEAWLGKTPGKMITKTKVVDQNGETPGLKRILWRSLARLIPFDAFTFLRERPTGMHDNLSRTIVVEDRPRLTPDRFLTNWAE